MKNPSRNQNGFHQSGKKIKHSCPTWVDWNEDKQAYELNDSAKVIQTIYELSAKGYGQWAIADQLNQTVKPIGRSDRWSRPFVKNILTSRTVIGEYQPHTRKDGEAIPVGDPITDYYPAAISLDLFHKSNAAAGQRRKKTTKTHKGYINLLSGLLECQQKHSTGLQTCRAISRNTNGYQYYIQEGGKLKIGEWEIVGMPMQAVDAAVLRSVSDLQMTQLKSEDAADDNESTKDSLQAELDSISPRLTQLEEEMEQGDIAILATVARKLTARQKELTQQLDELQQQAATPAKDNLYQLKKLIQNLTTADDRIQIRSRLRQLVERIVMKVSAEGHSRLADIVIHLKSQQKVKVSVATDGNDRSKCVITYTSVKGSTVTETADIQQLPK